MTGIVAQNVGRTSGLIKSAGGGGGVWTLISTFTSDGSDATADFTSGIDSTYPIYVFKFINIHPETDGAEFEFQTDTGANTDYDETATTTSFSANHHEDDSDAALSYQAGHDQAQSTQFVRLQPNAYNANDNGVCGTLHIFNPSSSVFVKHFLSTTQSVQLDNVGMSINYNVGGYFNVTTALTRFQFKFSSGEIQGGKIKLYGLSDS